MPHRLAQSADRLSLNGPVSDAITTAAQASQELRALAVRLDIDPDNDRHHDAVMLRRVLAFLEQR